MIQINSLIKKYLPANYKDCFGDKITEKPYISVNELFNLMFTQYPKWIMSIYNIRNLIVKPFGIKINKSFVNMIIEQDDNEIIIGSQYNYYCEIREYLRQDIFCRNMVIP